MAGTARGGGKQRGALEHRTGRLECFVEGKKSEIACFHSKAALASAVAFRFVLTAVVYCPIQLEFTAGWHWEASDSHQVFICL